MAVGAGATKDRMGKADGPGAALGMGDIQSVVEV